MLAIEKERLAASVLIFGFEGTRVSEEVGELIQLGTAGTILMRRNVTQPAETFALCGELRAKAGRPFLVSIDQEGGRVARLREGYTPLPSLRRIGQTGNPELARQMGRILGRECHAVGIDLDYAPVVDVDSNPQNPVIADRSFSSEPLECARFGVAMIGGLQEWVGACAKHFPGHGDTHQDSHLDLPRLSHSLERLRAIELPPFRAAVQAGVATLMTAHVVIEALDRDLPATLSHSTLEGLRAEIGFDGVMISDDLEMAAIADRFSISEAASKAIGAGCDLLLVCHRADRQLEAVRGLCRWAEQSTANLDRLRQASKRVRNLASRLGSSVAKAFESSDLRRPDALAFAETFASEASRDPTEPRRAP